MNITMLSGVTEELFKKVVFREFTPVEKGNEVVVLSAWKRSCQCHLDVVAFLKPDEHETILVEKILIDRLKSEISKRVDIRRSKPGDKNLFAKDTAHKRTHVIFSRAISLKSID